MSRATASRPPLSVLAQDLLGAIAKLGGEATTRRIAAQLAKDADLHREPLMLAKNLETLERAGKITSSLTLDRLERIWSLEPGHGR